MRLSLSPDERALYADVTSFIRGQLAPVASAEVADVPPGNPEVLKHGTSGVRSLALPSTYRFTLQTLQREIGSSPLAARSTLLALAEVPALRDRRLALGALAARAGGASPLGPRPTRWRSS